MVRSLMAFALVIGLSVSAVADVVTIPLTFIPATSTYNTIHVDIDSSIGDDSDNAEVLDGSYVELRLDYTIDSMTNAITSLNSIDFVGGSYDLENTHFDLGVWPLNADIDGRNIGGTFYTPSPHGSVTSSTTTPSAPYVNTAVFPTEEHMVRVDRGYLKIDPTIGDTTYFYLDENPLWGTTESDGTLITTLSSVVGGVANYNVEFTFPAYFQETVEDIVTATVTGNGTFKATGSFSIQPSNSPPVAVDDYYTLDEDERCLKYSSEGITQNDSDPDGDPMAAYKVTETSHGRVLLWTSGGFTYTPNADYFGTDSFTYKVFDGEEWSGDATVNFDIAPINDAPVGVDDSFSVDEDGTLTLYGYEGVLTNDTDVDDTVIYASKESDPEHGVITSWYANGGFTYRPIPGYSGEDSFTYMAYDDESAYSELVTVLIDVIATPIDVPGDTNDDDIVNEIDAQVLADNWGEYHTGVENGDFDGDGYVGPADASILAAQWGDHTGESGTSVPEPNTMFFLIAGLFTMAFSRRRNTP